VQDRRITVTGGVRLHYRDWGNPTYPVLVLLHGSGLTARAYDSLACGLADRYRVIVPDLRGHGESDRADEYTWELVLNDIDGIVRTLAMSPVTMVGHAIGAQLAAGYTARRPTSVMRLVLIDWAPGATFAPESGQAFAPLFEQRAIRNPEDLLRAAKASQPRLVDSEFRQVIMSNLVDGDDRRLTWRFDPRALGDGLAFEMNEAPASEMIRRILCPTLLIRAIESQYVTRDQAARAIGLLPNGRLVQITESGHGVPWEQPRRLLNEVRSFVNPASDAASP
jgi:pimeloyl-ACP methyl ester carboxylesterase